MTGQQSDGAPRPNRRRISVLGVVGELLITGGVVVLLFLVWQNWFNDWVIGIQQHSISVQQSAEWDRQDGVKPGKTVTTATAPSASQSPSASPGLSAAPDPSDGSSATPVVGVAPANTKVFAHLIVPRFGANFDRQIAEGTGVDVLNQFKVGHYAGTQMPGQIGNFAIASHRTAYGGALHNIVNLQVGDHIYIETKDGWYLYIFRTLEFVRPSTVNVLDAVPQTPGAVPTERLITMTTCNPLLSTAERVIAYGVFKTWYPRADGPPAEIAATVQAGSK